MEDEPNATMSMDSVNDASASSHDDVAVKKDVEGRKSHRDEDDDDHNGDRDRHKSKKKKRVS